MRWILSPSVQIQTPNKLTQKRCLEQLRRATLQNLYSNSSVFCFHLSCPGLRVAHPPWRRSTTTPYHCATKPIICEVPARRPFNCFRSIISDQTTTIYLSSPALHIICIFVRSTQSSGHLTQWFWNLFLMGPPGIGHPENKKNLENLWGRWGPRGERPLGIDGSDCAISARSKHFRRQTGFRFEKSEKKKRAPPA